MIKRQATTLSVLLAATLFCGQVTAQQAEPAKAPPTKETTAETSAEDAARKIQEFYAKTSDYQASFEQTYHDLAAGSKKSSIGRVYFKKPGMMRWDYKNAKTPKQIEKLYVSDGKSFWVYEYQFKQVFKQCLKDSQLPTSLAFLMGTGDLLSEFDVSYSKESTKNAPQLRLVPKEPTSKYKELRFTVDPKTWQVTRTAIYDPYGNMNEIVFTSARVNKNLPKSGFDFKVPKGARVLNPQQQCP